jgi:hypothetical protein
MSAEETLKKLEILLPEITIPSANYVPFRLHRDTLWPEPVKPAH